MDYGLGGTGRVSGDLLPRLFGTENYSKPARTRVDGYDDDDAYYDHDNVCYSVIECFLV